MDDISDEYCSDVDLCFMNRKVDSFTEECTSTNALVLESKISDEFSASERDTDSQHSGMTDDICMDNSRVSSAVVEHILSPPTHCISALIENYCNEAK
jgi:hypothetical protein